jgi:CDP-glucose 4,6-dehydratase
VDRKPNLEIMEIERYLNFYKGKKVLITGHTGFKGSWLTIWLNYLGAEVIGIALDPVSSEDNYVLSGISNEMTDYRVEIGSLESIIEIVEFEKPEILFHLAAQPIVIESYDKPIYTFETNIIGTANLLEIIRRSELLNTGVFITTDKCYENIEKDYSYKETDPMGGYDPYSASKGAAELVISSYRRSFFQKNEKKVASARAGNVIGGGDWSPYRLMVDIIKGIEEGEDIRIRNPKSTRPWQHVLEPLGGYILLAAKMSLEKNYDSAWNFGPRKENIVTVEEIINRTINIYGKGKWLDVSDKVKLHEATLLSLDITKAKEQLGWKPVFDLESTIFYTVDWYKNYKTENVKNICIRHINDYMKLWKSKSEN